MRNWIVVANASRARVLEPTDETGTYVHVADLVHPQSRQKGSELADDRPGRMPGPSAHGPGGSAFDARTDVHVREHDRFAREVAAVLQEGLSAGRCAGFVLVASNPFLGLVTEHLGPVARKGVLRSVVADYTSLNERDLANRLAG